MEVFVANGTNEDVWFDDFSVMSTTPHVVQETHYDPWGLELFGIGYQYAGIKVNKYLYPDSYREKGTYRRKRPAVL